MRLKCVSRYFSHWGSFKPGEIINVPDSDGEQILRSSPGSFEIVGTIEAEETPAPDIPAMPEPNALEEAVSAMSEETETGLVVPDRRARGGRKRKAKKRGN